MSTKTIFENLEVHKFGQLKVDKLDFLKIKKYLFPDEWVETTKFKSNQAVDLSISQGFSVAKIFICNFGTNVNRGFKTFL